ncbi:MAG: glycoside hydrolase family 3 N-terminal domain-containing protein [Gemmatimonadaceae bacterium]
MSALTRRDLAALCVPVVRAAPGSGFADERARIDAALALGVGGFQLVGGEQDAVRLLAKELQQRSSQKLLIAADLERGAGQQFRGATGLPPLAALVTLGDLEALRRAARLTAREARTMGVNWNFAPVADLDRLETNPVMGTRTLGQEPRAVATLVAAWIEACQGEGVLACAKHFPGMGRVTVDPSLALPVVTDPADQLKEQDGQPFRAAITAGVASIMTAHVAYPALDGSRVAATHSRELLQWSLRQQLKFTGIIVSDALSMAAALEGMTAAESVVRALRAGCDLVLDPGDLETTLTAMETALADGTLDPEQLRLSLRRRLKWAQWASPPNEWRRPSGADTAWGGLVADKVLRVEQGPLPTLGAVTEVVVVDDDEPVDQPGADTAGLAEALRATGHDARPATHPGAASGGPPVIAPFAHYHAGKGRTQLRPDTVAKVQELLDAAALLQRPVILVGFGDPRWAAQLPQPMARVVAWSRDRVMQQAAARALLRSVSGPAGR